MTPHTHPRRHIHVSGRLVRRLLALVAAVLAIVGAPLVAQALDDDVASVPERRLAGPAALPAPAVADLGATIDAPAALAPLAVAERLVDPPTNVLTEAYVWDERGPRVVALQEALGISADGWYTYATHHAHRSVLETFGLPTDALPTPVLPLGPSAEQWAALRECESGGDYSITNPSGKYRGAYQFDRSTWDSIAERHAPYLVGVDPAAASPSDQDLVAWALYTERGPGPWPLCGRHLS